MHRDEGKINPADSTLSSRAGKVYLVGGGPGDPQLLTLKAVRCLRRADVIVTDQLVHPAVFRWAKPAAQIIPVAEESRTDNSTCHPCSKEKHRVYSLLIEEARRGRTVVRLKGGCPGIFARLAEETQLLREAKVDYEIVPGITAALGAAAYAEVPLTAADASSAVALVTGHQRPGKQGLVLDYQHLASFPGTLVIYMGVATAAEWSRALIEGGRPPDTPVLIVQQGTWEKQRTYRCRLDEVDQKIAQYQIRPPAVFIIGEVVRLAPRSSWFEARPLFGKRILVPAIGRYVPVGTKRLRALGAQVLVQPYMDVMPGPDVPKVEKILQEAGSYRWIVFSDAFAVRTALQQLWKAGLDTRALAGRKLVAFRASAARVLALHHLRPDFTMAGDSAEEKVSALIRSAGSPEGMNLLWVTGIHRDRKARRLLYQEKGEISVLCLARCTAVQQADSVVAQSLAQNEIDWIWLPNPAAAVGLCRLFKCQLRAAQLVSGGPRTSAVLRSLGYSSAVEVSTSTDEFVNQLLKMTGSCQRPC
jgi:uroporphyrinogen III methyltransferase/synthase